MVQYSFTSTETRRLVRTDSPGGPRTSTLTQLLNYENDPRGSSLYKTESTRDRSIFCTDGPPTQPSLCVDAMHVIRIPQPLQTRLSQVPRGAPRRCRRSAVSIEIDKTIAAAARMPVG